MKIKALLISIFLSLMLSACISSFYSNNTNPNGASIYYDGVNQSGTRIRSTGGVGGGMMNIVNSCASCHGNDGSGGIHIMHMNWMDAPDIRFSTLENHEDDHVEEENANHDDNHADEHSNQAEYSIDQFRLAVIEGQHPGGDSLSYQMPRWTLSDQDLVDLFEFIQSLENSN